jgi:hypothetical protein
MLYSLPTGKVIEMSIDQFLEITDEELEYLISINYGESIENPFFGSILERPAPADVKPKSPKVVPIEPLIEEIDESIDYTPEEE